MNLIPLAVERAPAARDQDWGSWREGTERGQDRSLQTWPLLGKAQYKGVAK